MAPLRLEVVALKAVLTLVSIRRVECPKDGDEAGLGAGTDHVGPKAERKRTDVMMNHGTRRCTASSTMNS